MAQFKDAWLEHQRQRWMRSNAQLWMRPDAYRFLPPSESNGHKGQPRGPIESHGAVCDVEAELRQLRCEVASLRLAWELRKFASKERKAGFNPGQPRDELGQWTDTGGGQGRSGGSDGAADQESAISTLALVIRICILNSAARITDAFGNKSCRATYECAGSRFFTREGPGHNILALVGDPLQ